MSRPGTVRTADAAAGGRRQWNRAFFANRWTRVGLVLIAVGWTPLWGIVLLAELGLWPDPDPNPVGPGLLFFFTAWPAVVCIVVGAVQTRRGQSDRSGPPSDEMR